MKSLGDTQRGEQKENDYKLYGRIFVASVTNHFVIMNY